jgi:hypothetical protein
MLAEPTTRIQKVKTPFGAGMLAKPTKQTSLWQSHRRAGGMLTKNKFQNFFEQNLQITK